MVNRLEFIKLPVIKKVITTVPKEMVIDGHKELIPFEKVVKETRYGEYFNVYAIQKVEPHLDLRMKRACKTRCEILYDHTNSRYVIAKPQEEVYKLINNFSSTQKIGFKYGNNI